VSASNADHGQAIFNTLQLNSNIEVTVPSDGPVIISCEAIDDAKAKFCDFIKDTGAKKPPENVLVTLYTPYLMEVMNEVDPRLRLLNSERYKWLQCMSNHRPSDMMPDLFSAYYALVEFLKPYKNAPECLAERLFGKFANWDSRSSIHCIWDAKWKITMEAFGEKCKYLQIAGEDCVDHNGVALQLRGVLFDVEEFWMIKSSGNTIVSLVKCKWSENGSRNRLVSFLRVVDPWLEATTAMCEQLGVAIEDYSYIKSPLKRCALLGTGANGRVFKLNNQQVIKIVVGEKSDKVEQEYKLMLSHLGNEVVAFHVFPLLEGSYRDGSIRDVKYAGYLLTSEGEHITLPVDSRDAVAVALFTLHKSNVIHGDPRIANLLKLDGDLKWIDFRESQTVTTKISIRHDVEILFKSLGGCDENAKGAIGEYMDAPTLEKLQHILSMSAEL
jgi:hypothetical protein